MRETRRISSGRRLLLYISLGIYLAALAVVVSFMFEPEEEPEPIFGSLEGRFGSDIMLEFNGAEHYYRENEITNYLIVGVDRRDAETTVSHQRGGQADFIVVLSIDRIHRTITPVMLDRDTMTEVQTYGVFGHPAGTRTMQLCLAQAYSGVSSTGTDNTAEAVEKLLFGVSMDRRVMLDMEAIALINDALGGVEVMLKDDFTVYDPAMTKGTTLRLMGEQAEFFVRGRMTVADGTNASRMERQQQYLSALLTQFRQTAEGDMERLNELLTVVEGHMVADARDEILLREVDAYSGYQWLPMQTLTGRHALDEEGFAEFWLDEDALRRLVATIWFAN